MPSVGLNGETFVAETLTSNVSFANPVSALTSGVFPTTTVGFLSICDQIEACDVSVAFSTYPVSANGRISPPRRTSTFGCTTSLASVQNHIGSPGIVPLTTRSP